MDEKAAVPLEYTTQGSRSPLWKDYLIWFGVSWVICVLTAAVFIFGISRFREVFKDFRTELPMLTEWIMQISDFIAMQWGWVLALLLPFLLPLPVVVMEAVCGREKARLFRRGYRISLVTVVLAMIGMVIIGLALPLVKLVNAVHGGP